jgi:hypothetical protein
MAIYTLSPLPRVGIATGSGYKLYTYDAGTLDAVFTYSNDSGTQNANPVEANAAGLFPAIYLEVGNSYKFILKTDADVTVWTQDGIAAVPTTDDLGDVTGTAGEDLATTELAYLSDGSGGKNAGQWYRTDATNTYSSITAELGYPTTAIASGATGTFRQVGRQAGLTGLTPGATYYISAASLGAITAVAPAHARAAGVSDTATSLVLFPQPRWQDTPVPVVQTTTSTGTVNDFAITSGPTAILLRANNATSLTLTGFATPSAGKRIEIYSIGVGSVILANATGSTAANQIVTGLGANLTLTAGLGRAALLYDGTTARWRVLNYTAGSANLIQEGVLFPAVQVASSDVNCLDDYEEGTWTPVIGGSGGTSGQTYATQVGRYIKVGRMVSASFRIVFSVKGTITTNVQLQGLPFTAVNVAGLFPISVVRFSALATNWVNIIATVAANTTTADITGAASATTTNTTSLATADIANNSEFAGTILYFSES